MKPARIAKAASIRPLDVTASLPPRPTELYSTISTTTMLLSGRLGDRRGQMARKNIHLHFFLAVPSAATA
jgi:hypothetical protein